MLSFEDYQKLAATEEPELDVTPVDFTTYARAMAGLDEDVEQDEETE